MNDIRTETEKFMDALRGNQFIVINDCYGGFGLSDRARKEYCEATGIDSKVFIDRDIRRDDPYLVKIVRDLGMAANGAHSNLKIVEIPGDVEWQVEEYDGAEWVAEKHRTWG